jgi:methyl-accepting chemotaxis protein
MDSLLNRLLLWQKFVILGAVALVLAAIPTYLYLKNDALKVQALEMERSGLQPAAAILKVVQNTQQHRGLSALFLGDVPGSAEKRTSKQQDVDQAFARMDAIVSVIADNNVAQAWAEARRDWDQLRSGVAGRTLDIPGSFAAHTALMPKLLLVNELICDFYGLNLDPQADTYQLIQAMYYQLPYLTEETGKMRAKGAGLLAKQAAATEDKLAVSGIVARVTDRLRQTTTAFNKSRTANPDFEKRFGGSIEAAVEQTTAVSRLAQSRIALAETLDFPSTEYVSLTTKAIDAQFNANELASKGLAEALEQRIDASRMQRWTVIGSMALLLAVAVMIAWLVAKSVSEPLHRAVEIAQRVAEGDLTVEIRELGNNETGQLLRSLKTMNSGLVSLVGQVRTGAEQIATASNQIATGNLDLSSRTEQQASSLEETASSMEELTSTVRQNGDNARQANQLALSASQVAGRGGAAMHEVVTTMESISTSSKQITEIIGVINSISFQTNILALNAAVEAARAGEQGRGFAVVASEVRALAQRSSQAAKEIKTLIDASAAQVENGVRLVTDAGATMGEIVDSIRHVADIVSEITAATSEQIAGIEQINQAVSEMDNVTQQNAALVEQAAAAAESLQEQARHQSNVVSIFKLDDQPAAAARALPAKKPAPRLRA